jgi:hypothetical protein
VVWTTRNHRLRRCRFRSGVPKDPALEQDHLARQQYAAQKKFPEAILEYTNALGRLMPTTARPKWAWRRL